MNFVSDTNWTEWSTIHEVIIQIISESDKHLKLLA